jgi:thioredoxin reductase (NADPH)
MQHSSGGRSIPATTLHFLQLAAQNSAGLSLSPSRLHPLPDTLNGVSVPSFFQFGRMAGTRFKGLSRTRHGQCPIDETATDEKIMTDEIRDTIIVGTGCAGLTAAIYAARANLKPLVLEGHEPGGQLSITTLVENFPGWPEGIQGPQLIENMRLQASRFGTDFRLGHMTSVDLSKRPFQLHVGKDVLHARTLIIASGASARWLGLPSEHALIGHGVSSCATCDGFFFSGQEIAVIGGGDSAMEEALFLTRFASKVTLIHRREQFRASKIMLDRAIGHEKIKFLTNTTVEEVLGVEKKEVTGLRLRNLVTQEESILPVSAMFLGIGHVPNAKMFTGQIELDDDGYIRTHDYVFTRVAGVFACGDVQDRRYRQAITAAGSGCMAALEAEKYLEEHGR